MISTVTELCNLALSRIGARRLLSYETDETTEARSCRLHYEQVRDGLLRRHQWDFAERAVTLNKLAGVTPAEFSEAWQLPADCVRIIRLTTGDRGAPVQSFSRRGRHLLTTGYSAVTLIHVSNAVPIVEWDSLFVDALKLKLAAEIASDVTQNPEMAAGIASELERLALPVAQTADAREANSGENSGPADLIRTSTLCNLRRSYRSPTPRPGIP